MADAEPIAVFCADLAVTRWLARVPHPYPEGEAERFLSALAEQDGRHWAIEAPGAGLVGVIGLDGPAGARELGYWLGRPFWGRGWMGEAARAVVAAAFAAGEPRLVSGAFEGNARSLAIQRRLGFAETGRRRLACRALGRDLVHVDTRLDRAEWRAEQEARA